MTTLVAVIIDNIKIHLYPIKTPVALSTKYKIKKNPRKSNSQNHDHSLLCVLYDVNNMKITDKCNIIGLLA